MSSQPLVQVIEIAFPFSESDKCFSSFRVVGQTRSSPSRPARVVPGSGTVNYSVAANTLSISRSSSLTIAGLTHNVSQVGTGGGCTNTIVNPGFESGTTPWTFSGQVTRSTGSFPHSGTAYALQFWLNITTNEAAGASVFDRLFIEVRSTSGTLLATLATFSNQNSGTAGVYVLRGPFNLSSFAGQTVRIQFRGTNDITLPTIFRVDDVSLQ